ncbi:MAG: class I SAM-dependent methyltransferase [Planctomycetes bacterium]|nr:class I SAM-dependent methyltransferase [Planctomycetota bacterium]
MERNFSERAQETRQLERWNQVYRSQPELFRLFERAEDAEGLAAHALAKRAGLAGQRVLEIGCGTGWLTRHIAGLAEEYVAVEPSPEMLAQAGDLTPAHVLRARGERLPFAADSFDRVVMSWVLLDLRPAMREQVLAECDRVLKYASNSDYPTGKTPGIWLVENAASGDFQALRNLLDEEGHGEAAPLIFEHGFTQVTTVPTRMQFQSTEEARRVLSAILGTQAEQRLAAAPRASFGLDLGLFFRSGGSRPS